MNKIRAWVFDRGVIDRTKIIFVLRRTREGRDIAGPEKRLTDQLSRQQALASSKFWPLVTSHSSYSETRNSILNAVYKTEPQRCLIHPS